MGGDESISMVNVNAVLDWAYKILAREVINITL